MKQYHSNCCRKTFCEQYAYIFVHGGILFDTVSRALTRALLNDLTRKSYVYLKARLIRYLYFISYQLTVLHLSAS